MTPKGNPSDFRHAGAPPRDLLKSLLAVHRGTPGESDLKILDFLHKVRVREVPEEELAAFDPAFRFIMNLNSPEDLEKARLIAADANAPSYE